MNGLLHRVAARAAGTAAVVRSDAGLPYAGGGLGVGDAGEAQADFAGSAAPRSQMQQAAAVHGREGPGEPPPPVAAATDAAVVRDASATAQNAGAAQPSSIDEPSATMAPLLARPAPVVIEPEAAGAGAAGEIPAAAYAPLRADEPGRLMPREARPPPPAPGAPPARYGTLPQGAALAPGEADTEVHIHIGRIDVTAVHETPAARRRPAAAPAPMSLDGYLAKRGGS